MALQNLVSAVMTPELKSSILTKLNELKGSLGFVVSILPEEKKDYVRIGSDMLPFLDIAHGVIETHPEILPGVFDKEEYNKDYQFSKDLAPIVSQINEIQSSLQNTQFAVNSDLMVETLEVYAAVLQNEDKVPGLDVIAAQMRAFFKKTRKAKNEVKQ